MADQGALSLCKSASQTLTWLVREEQLTKAVTPTSQPHPKEEPRRWDTSAVATCWLFFFFHSIININELTMFAAVAKARDVEPSDVWCRRIINGRKDTHTNTRIGLRNRLAPFCLTTAKRDPMARYLSPRKCNASWCRAPTASENI